MQYDPKLKKAMAEIKQIIEKYDIGGIIFLANGKEHLEFLNKVDPTWSAMSIEKDHKGAALRVQVDSKKLGKKKALEVLNRSYNMLTLFVDQLFAHLQVYRQMKELLSMEIHVIEEDKGSVTGEQEQNN